VHGFLLYFLVCLLMGAATETLAALLKLWRYRSPALLLNNIVVVFGLVFGGLLWLLQGQGLLLQFAAGAAFGLAYEAANFAFLNGWSFPGERLWLLQGRIALTVGVGLAWGFIVPVAGLLSRLLAGAAS
jgi:hypothetical protein